MGRLVRALLCGGAAGSVYRNPLLLLKTRGACAIKQTLMGRRRLWLTAHLLYGRCCAGSGRGGDGGQRRGVRQSLRLLLLLLCA